MGAVVSYGVNGVTPRKADGARKPRWEWRTLAPAIAGALLFGAAGFASARVGGAGVDREASDFHAPIVLNAEAVDGASELHLEALRGRAVVLDFWASWCGPCRAEAPILQRLYAAHAAEGLVMVGVNTSDELENAAPTARKLGMQFPVVFDQHNAIAKAYGVSSLPSLVVISRTGKIIAVRVGVTSADALEELIRQALAS